MNNFYDKVLNIKLFIVYKTSMLFQSTFFLYIKALKFIITKKGDVMGKYLFNTEKLLEIDGSKIIRFDENIFKIKKAINIVSKETNVPKKFIFKPPYKYFLDHWFKVDNEWYFYKGYQVSMMLINELLGEKVSEYFDLETIHYRLAKFNYQGNSEIGLASKSFCQSGFKYKRAHELHLEEKEDLSVVETIRKICKNDQEYKTLLLDIKKMFVRDFMCSENDRHEGNFLFKINSTGIRLAPLFDYEDSFIQSNPLCYHNWLGSIDLNSFACIETIQKDPEWQELFEKAMQLNIPAIIEEIKDENQLVIPLDYTKYYIDSVDCIKNLIKSNKLIK